MASAAGYCIRCSALPDELVKDILSSLLAVPDHLFHDTSDTSPFALSTYSSSAYLGVCKQWMRVATPLFYEVVILRTTAQAKSLRSTLKWNPDLGNYIKKLRVEGGFGKAMFKIVSASPKITDVCLTMGIRKSDDVSGLVDALPLLNPVRVTVREGKPEQALEWGNKPSKTFAHALCKWIRKWKSLRIFDYPYDQIRTLSMLRDFGRGLDIAYALSRSPSLEIVNVSPAFSSAVIQNIAENTNLKCICVKAFSEKTNYNMLEAMLGRSFGDYLGEGDADALSGFFRKVEQRVLETSVDRDVVEADDRLRSLVIYEDASAGDTTLIQANPFFRPMKNVPMPVAVKIWARVIHFAAGSNSPSIKRVGTSAMDLKDEARELCRTRLNIALVCKGFWRLTERYLYQDILLEDFETTIAFSALLKSNPFIAARIRTLSLFSRSGFLDREDSDEQIVIDAGLREHKDAVSALSNIFTKANNLVSVRHLTDILDTSSDCPLSWEVLEGFPGTRSNHAEELIGTKLYLPIREDSFLALRRFVNLKELAVECQVKERWPKGLGKVAKGKAPSTVKFQSRCLAKLQKLSYGEVYDEGPWESLDGDVSERQPSLLGILERMKLPSIHEVNICSTIPDVKGYLAFLRTHGPKLRALKVSDTDVNLCPFSWCPNLRTFTLAWETVPDASFFSPSNTRVRTLEKIIIEGTVHCFEETADEWNVFFKTVDFSSFPSLKELQILACQWPTNEREYNSGRRVWIGRSVLMMQKFKVRLTDSRGRCWVPRLGMDPEEIAN